MWRKLFHPIRIPLFERAEEIVRSLRASGRTVFYILSALIIGSALGLLFLLNENLKVSVPVHGGSLTEGIVGTPRFINPVLANSDVDRDLVALVYSGLLKVSPKGDFVPDLAESYSVSEDGRVYTAHLRRDAIFQDGSPVTADDVKFTIAKAVDPAIKSPVRANWEGVQVATPDQYTVEFTLAKPYAPFVDNLTMGILEKRLWQDVTAEEFPFSELNTTPIGSGPYAVGSITRTSSGIPSSYQLSAFDKYALGAPYISQLVLRFYQSEDALVAALRSGAVEAGSAISPGSLSGLGDKQIESIPLNRVFGVFFNQNQSTVLRDGTVRKALSDAIDRDALVAAILDNHGTPLEGPIPPALLNPVAIIEAYAASTHTSDTARAATQSDTVTAYATSTDSALKARARLIAAGWKVGDDGYLQKTTDTGKMIRTEKLSFSLATANVPELSATANLLKEEWGRMGANVTVDVYNQGDLSENIIRPRKYDALLFGEIIGRSLDLYAFWSSSERSDPGLNIALYANSTVDALLDQLRTADSDSTRQALFSKISAQIENDMPAVFLYSPDFVYVVPQDMNGMSFSVIENPSDRFSSIESWYRQTDSVWGVFAR